MSTCLAALVDLLYFLLTQKLGVNYLIPLTEDGTNLVALPAFSVAVTVLVAGLAASLFFGLLIRFTRSAKIIFLSVSITAFVVSLGGPFGLPQAATQTKLLLAGMHVVAAFLIIGGILFLTRTRIRK